VIINDLELWWERTDNGIDVLNVIFNLMESFSRKILFIVNCNVHAYNFINMIQPIENNFVGVIKCEPFSAEELKSIIMPRHESTRLIVKINSKGEQSFNKWREVKMFNKMFEYSDGVIGPALYSWISNILKYGEEAIHISYPEIPHQRILDNLSSIQKIILLQFILHNKLSINSIPTITRLDSELIDEELIPLVNYSLIDKHGEILEISPFLLPFIVREFKRKGLL